MYGEQKKMLWEKMGGVVVLYTVTKRLCETRTARVSLHAKCLQHAPMTCMQAAHSLGMAAPPASVRRSPTALIVLLTQRMCGRARNATPA